MNPSEFFDSQLRCLEEAEFPKQAVRILRGQKNRVLERYAKMRLGEGNLPFLAVLPRPYLPMLEIMPRYFADKIGKVLNVSQPLREEMLAKGEAELVIINPKYVSDMEAVPDDPYFIYDVEDGGSNAGKLLQESEKEILRRGRRCLTVAEVWSLHIQTGVLARLRLLALGSRFNTEYYPFLYADRTSKDRPGPRLHHFTQLNFVLGDYAVPSRSS